MMRQLLPKHYTLQVYRLTMCTDDYHFQNQFAILMNPLWNHQLKLKTQGF